MGNFLNIALTFPPIVFSLLLVVVVIYWLSVVVGVLDLDLFELDLDIDADLDLDVETDIGGATEGAVEGVSDLPTESRMSSIRAGVFSWLSLGRVPVTILISFFTLYAWIMTFSGVYYFGASLPVAIVLFAGSIVASLFFTGLTVRPMRGIFHTQTKHGQATLIGSLCVVTTGRVDSKFGQALFDDGGAGLNLPIRCDSTDNQIKRGERVLIIGYDPETRLYQVEAYENLDGPQETEFDFDTRLEDAKSTSDVALNSEANSGDKE